MLTKQTHDQRTLHTWTVRTPDGGYGSAGSHHVETSAQDAMSRVLRRAEPGSRADQNTIRIITVDGVERWVTDPNLILTSGPQGAGQRAGWWAR